MTGHRVPRTRLGFFATLGTCILLVMLLSAFGGSPGKGGASMLTKAPAAASSGKVAVGVTPKTIKVGIALVNFECIRNFVDSIREKQQQVYQAYIDNINAKGGIAGRKIVPVYDTYCPLGSAGPLAVCTKLTDDDKVFAVIGTFVDFSGDAQTCVANQHHRVLMTFNLTQAIMNQSPAGLIIYPGATNERTVKVLLQLLSKQHALKGKKAAVLGGSQEASTVNKTIVPGLKKLKVPLGSTAVLSINGTADTTAAQAQLDSFIEKWKGQHVNTVFLSGDEVSSKQFVTKLRQEMPKVTLISDTTDTRDFGKQETHAGIKPNPYEGLITAGGPTPAEYDKSANYAYCAAIYKKYTKKNAPKSTTVIKASGGKTVDTYGSINDACQALTMFHDIGTKVGKTLNNANWVKAVNHYGAIVNRGSGPYSSLHRGKYDVEDNFRLQEFASSIKPDGDWKGITPVENITGQ
jgi:ABC-type branched-subunit amino acid transport system substrate-binding protein